MSPQAGEPSEEWRRTSLLGVFAGTLIGLRNAVLPLVAVFYGGKESQDGAVVMAVAVPAVLGIVLGMSYLNWRRTRYRLGESDIRLEKGLLNRTARSVPYERIQDVSLEQALIPRLFGLVEVKFETGAGGKDELKLAYVGEAEGAALRDTVRTRKSGEAVEPGTAAVPEEPPARTLFAMDLRRLATFGVFEFSLVVFAVLGGAAQQFDFLLPFDLWDFDKWVGIVAGPGHRLAELGFAVQAIGATLALGALAVVGLVTGLGRTVLRDYGFLLEETPKGLRRRRGLLTRTDMVMPLQRVQALKVTTGIVRRRFGWHGLEVVSLGSDAKSASHVVVPFAQLDEIAPVVRMTGLALPEAAATWRRPSPRHYVDRAVLGAVPLLTAAFAVVAVSLVLPQAPAWLPLVGAGLVVLTAFSVIRERYLWHHDRHALDGKLIFVRRGWLAPSLDIAPRLKLQSVEIAQGPIARRRGYADVKFGLAGGTLELHGLPLDDARAIRAAVLDSIATVDFSRLAG